MTDSSSILIVDDDKEIRDLLANLLNREGYRCSIAANGDEMFVKLAQEQADLILLDIMLPGRDGFELCRQLRADPAMPPVIMLTAKDEEVDQVVGLEIGADDYIVKPFRSRELLARIKDVMRRTRVSHSRQNREVFVFGNWRFHPAQMELVNENAIVTPLSSSETSLLLAFVQNPQIPLSRDRLLDLTKGRSGVPFDRSIDSHISRLRRKLGDNAKTPKIIKTAWGTGYFFTYKVQMM